jgi:hypothetical protein
LGRNRRNRENRTIITTREQGKKDFKNKFLGKRRKNRKTREQEWEIWEVSQVNRKDVSMRKKKKRWRKLTKFCVRD